MQGAPFRAGHGTNIVVHSAPERIHSSAFCLGPAAVGSIPEKYQTSLQDFRYSATLVRLLARSHPGAHQACRRPPTIGRRECESVRRSGRPLLTPLKGSNPTTTSTCLMGSCAFTGSELQMTELAGSNITARRRRSAARETRSMSDILMRPMDFWQRRLLWLLGVPLPSRGWSRSDIRSAPLRRRKRASLSACVVAGRRGQTKGPASCGARAAERCPNCRQADRLRRGRQDATRPHDRAQVPDQTAQ
jgi:hypothetical protein